MLTCTAAKCLLSNLLSDQTTKHRRSRGEWLLLWKIALQLCTIFSLAHSESASSKAERFACNAEDRFSEWKFTRAHHEEDIEQQG